MDDVEAVAAAGVEVLAVSGAIDDEAHRRLLDLGIKPSAGCRGTIWTCSLATGATVLHHVDALHADACGRVLESRSHMLGTFITGPCAEKVMQRRSSHEAAAMKSSRKPPLFR
ncbi:MAG: hypothetical protein CM15mP18_5290 [Methanobacteriota archaeon]|nr:MAG: hypothetical protein CM15mP18_5290 [Euryarchaeota archaeon]